MNIAEKTINLKKVKIEVLQEHITKGKRDDTNKCAIALAVRPHIKLSKRKSYDITTESVIYTMKDRNIYHELSPTVIRFMERFDSNEEKENSKAKPFSFITQVPEEFLVTQ